LTGFGAVVQDVRMFSTSVISPAMVSSALIVASLSLGAQGVAPTQPDLGHQSAPLLVVDGLQFKDLNRNGKLDVYEDWRKSAEVRADDLIQQMSMPQLAGTMLHGTLAATGGPMASIGIGGDGYDLDKANEAISGKGITTFITRLNTEPMKMADGANKLQAIAEAAPLGVPLTISTDPRNHFEYILGASVGAGQFSKWPETTGLAAIGSDVVTREFADIARQEYEAVGIREALSPQADLATEPRWGRLNGTFGEDAGLAKRLVEAYVEGMQNGKNGLNAKSVITVVKHWVGYGAQKDGFDSHNSYGRFNEVTDSSLAYHVEPFLGAFEAHAAAVMPTYSILEKLTVDGKPGGTRIEQVGAGMNKYLLTDLLRGKYKFDGVVVSDWGITEDCTELCQNGMPAGQKPGVAQIGMPWGVETLSKVDRFAKTINAGVDQVGGTEDAASLLAAITSGKISEDRVREAARRILVQKFELGLFEDPYVASAQANGIVGKPEFVKAGVEAQEHATVLLENKKHILPLKAGIKVYLFGIDAAAAKAHGFTVVDSPEKADVAIVRAETPFELLHPGYFFGSRQHEGRLNFQPGDAAYDAVLKCGKIPVVMTVSLDRPAVLTEVREKTAALLGNFGISDDALFAVLSGEAKPEGKLPFELPSSMEAVRAQRSDLPHDSAKPLYAFGFGLRY
jgi:beta-glucosidase